VHPRACARVRPANAKLMYVNICKLVTYCFSQNYGTVCIEGDNDVIYSFISTPVVQSTKHIGIHASERFISITSPNGKKHVIIIIILLRWPRWRKSLRNGLASVRLSVCLSVCPVGILTVTHQAAACEAASVHFGRTTRRTDILANVPHVHKTLMRNGRRGFAPISWPRVIRVSPDDWRDEWMYGWMRQ